jgi:hypothetical protein
VQLDRIPPRIDDLEENPGTPAPLGGVELAGNVAVAAPAVAARRGLRLRDFVALSMVCGSLLGQGETFKIDERFSTPSATLVTYWESLRSENVDQVAECFADPSTAEPKPGSIWFLPPSDKIEVRAVRYAPGEEGHVVATYEVRFVPRGSTEELSFVTGSELARAHGEWRLVGLADEVDWPEWKPFVRSVDI